MVSFSFDGRLMFNTDSPTQKINALPYKNDGTVGEP
jgi:hypothetical protein